MKPSGGRRFGRVLRRRLLLAIATELVRVDGARHREFTWSLCRQCKLNDSDQRCYEVRKTYEGIDMCLTCCRIRHRDKTRLDLGQSGANRNEGGVVDSRRPGHANQRTGPGHVLILCKSVFKE